MDLSFARRAAAFRPDSPQRLDLHALLADLSARQADSPTARLQSKMDGSNKIISKFDSKAALFAPRALEHKARNSASFSDMVAGLITERKGS